MQLDAKALKAAEDAYNDRDNSTTFRLLSEAIRAYLIALPVAAPLQVEPAEDVAELIGRLKAGPMLDDPWAAMTAAATALTSQSAELLSLRRKVEEVEAERDRCHARLEIDHEFVMTGDDDDLERREISMEYRAEQVDGIEARDCTIKLQDEHITELQETCASLRRALEPFAALDMPADEKWTCGTFLIEHADIRRARALAGDRP